MPEVSVIMPVYNAQRFLQAALDSVLSQDFADFELICVDDGSTDASREILEQAARGDARVRLFFQHNQYCGIARNTGLNNARGEYVAFLDADDLLCPGVLGRMVARAEETRAEVVLGAFRQFEKDPARAAYVNSGLDRRLLPAKEVFNLEDLGKGLFWASGVNAWGKLFRRSFLEEKQLRFYPLPRAEDVPFFVLVMTQARRIAVLDEPVVLYRRYLGSGSMEDTRDDYPLALLQAARYSVEDLRTLGLWERCRKPFLDRFLASMIYNLDGAKSFAPAEILWNAFQQDWVGPYGLKALTREDVCYEGLYDDYRRILDAPTAGDYLLISRDACRKEAADLRATANTLRRQRVALQKERDALDREKRALENSRSYRLGRALLWLPRKLLRRR